jgi:hypothetical protein
MKRTPSFSRLFIFAYSILCLVSCSKIIPDNPGTQTPANALDQKFLLEIRVTESFSTFLYADSVTMIVTVTKDNEVIVSGIKNFGPTTNTPTYTLGSCSATWIPDTLGEINITKAEGSIDGMYGDSSRNLFLSFSDSAAISPGFIKICSGGTPETDPAIPITGIPGFSYFTLQPGQNLYETDSGDEFDRLTLIK